MSGEAVRRKKVGKGKLKQVPLLELEKHDITSNGVTSGSRFQFGKTKCPSGSLCSKMTFLAVLVFFTLAASLYLLDYKEGQLTKVADDALEIIEDSVNIAQQQAKEMFGVVFQEGNDEKIRIRPPPDDSKTTAIPKTNAQSVFIDQEKKNATINEEEDESDYYVELLKENLDSKIVNLATSQLVKDPSNFDTVEASSKLSDDSFKAPVEVKEQKILKPTVSVASLTTSLPMKSTSIEHPVISSNSNSIGKGKQESLEPRVNPTEATTSKLVEVSGSNVITTRMSIKSKVYDLPSEAVNPKSQEKVQETMEKYVPPIQSSVRSLKFPAQSTPLETITSTKAKLDKETLPLKSLDEDTAARSGIVEQTVTLPYKPSTKKPNAFANPKAANHEPVKTASGIKETDSAPVKK